MPFYARSLARSIGRLVSFHFLSLRAHSTARHGTHNLQIQTNRTLHTIEQTGLEQKQPAKLRTAPKLTLFPSSSLSNALLPLQGERQLFRIAFWVILLRLERETGALQIQGFFFKVFTQETIWEQTL